MSKLILNEECGLYEMNGTAYCSSKQISEEFEKEHYNVMRDIENLDCSVEFRALNFEGSYYRTEQNKKVPQILMTKDGFTFLVFGYRGKKASRFKEAYIKRFNQMEDFIYSLQSAKAEYPALTAAMKDYKGNPKPHHFINEADMINRVVLGLSAKKFREANGIPDKQSIRPYLTTEQIRGIEEIQRVDVGLLVAAIDYDERKRILTQYYDRMSVKRIAA
ncbi:Rha family transcriptional regulator [Paenibacillus odorifer]|uniref:Rha family transcriptional regulator n=1 Tax=Paenibacillus odorifer TaxID=189426 RepID=UPI00096D95EC|nr:Rha family transcriptional regulator [Paenibacillus odorifer]OME12785.1 hypothetical protein BSK60_16920 [Paenibacillus odorifer]